jgi:UDP-N-acetylmuramate dehydrogenase
LKKWKKNSEGQFDLSYGGIRKQMDELGIKESELTSRKLADIIIAIRRQKLPDWEEVGTAGSFFKNPIISVEKYEELRREFPDLV